MAHGLWGLPTRRLEVSMPAPAGEHLAIDLDTECLWGRMARKSCPWELGLCLAPNLLRIVPESHMQGALGFDFPRI